MKHGLALVLVLGACGTPAAGPGLSLRLAALPADTGGCLGADGQGLPGSALVGQGGTVRLSVVRRDTGGARFVCDAVARVQDPPPRLDLGDGGASYEVHAEWFDPAGARRGQGALPALSLADQGGPPLLLPLYRIGAWSCPEGGLGAGRAFHSATPLPGGEVLLVGGLTDLPEAGPGTFQLLGSAEVYDPRAGRFFPVSEEEGVVPKTRAFHHAAVLDAGGGTVRVFLYGGVTAPPGKPALSGAPATPTQLRFTPIGTTLPAPAEVLSYDVATRHLVRHGFAAADFARVAFAGAAALPEGGLLAAGGESFPAGKEGEGVQSDLSPVLQATWVAPPAAGALPAGQGAALMPWLVAPSVTPLGGGAALVLGAARSAPGAMSPQVQGTALRLRYGKGAPQVDSSAAWPGAATVFHTATRLQDQGGMAQVLVAGGFVMEASSPIQARQPPPADQALRLYQVTQDGALALSLTALTPPGPAAACGSSGDHYRPAGFAAATATISGTRALLSGGTPTAALDGCQDCEDGDSGAIKLLCVLRQVTLYDAAGGTVSRGPPLSIGRMGHAQTLLTDGSILVTGGLSRPGGDATPALREAAVYGPRATGDTGDVDDPIAPLLRAQGLQRHGLGTARPCPEF